VFRERNETLEAIRKSALAMMQPAAATATATPPPPCTGDRSADRSEARERREEHRASSRPVHRLAYSWRCRSSASTHRQVRLEGLTKSRRERRYAAARRPERRRRCRLRRSVAVARQRCRHASTRNVTTIEPVSAQPCCDACAGSRNARTTAAAAPRRGLEELAVTAGVNARLTVHHSDGRWRNVVSHTRRTATAPS